MAQEVNCEFPFCEGGTVTAESLDRLSIPPILDRQKNVYHGGSCIGLVFSRYYSPEEEPMAHPKSATRQKQFDLNLIQDRSYQLFSSTGDDGWLGGGGESGEYSKIPSLDSAHIAVAECGTLRKEWGGIPPEDLQDLMLSGKIMIPQMAVIPSYLTKNPDIPPELEIRFELGRNEKKPVDEWENWPIVFLQNQLVAAFIEMGNHGCVAWPLRGLGDVSPFMSVVRKAGWKSLEHVYNYFDKCNTVMEGWRKLGPQLLTPESDPSKPGYPSPVLGKEIEEPYGVYLMKVRNQPIDYFPPNFHPPYNTPEKRALIKQWLDYPNAPK